jgi:hypothetical protein
LIISTIFLQLAMGAVLSVAGSPTVAFIPQGLGLRSGCTGNSEYRDEREKPGAFRTLAGGQMSGFWPEMSGFSGEPDIQFYEQNQ